MRDALAERLLSDVMEWSNEDMARERPILQSMAAFKYDEYQRFMPGMRFVESLALWLEQFGTKAEKLIAYDFIRERLIFCSGAEISHLVEMAYADYIKPRLFSKVAKTQGFHSWQVNKVAASPAFNIAQRKVLFLGLSDGARIDVFRRYNAELEHDQIYPTYEISDDRVASLLDSLQKDIAKLTNTDPSDSIRFETVVLLDDFSGSGVSYIREDNGQLKGKIVSFLKSATDPEKHVSKLFDISQTEFCVVLYIATSQARDEILSHLPKLDISSWLGHSVDVIDLLEDKIKIDPVSGIPFKLLIQKYYDDSVETDHTRKGGSDVRYGFGQCGLPLVLTHNTPNNSLALLWADTDKVNALFPRVSRHK